MAVNVTRRPERASPRLWVVLRADGDRHFIETELPGGILEWAQGQKGLTVVEYEFKGVVYDAPEDEPEKK